MRKLIFVGLFILAASVFSSAQTNDASWLTGSWQGTAHQSEPDGTWTMTLNVANGKYSVSYPSLKCSGDWRVVSIKRDVATFVETIRNGLKDCESDGNVVVELVNENQISFQWAQSNSTKVLAYAVLDRKSPR